MLSLTEEAARKITELLDATDLPAEAGLRLAQREDHAALEMGLVACAEPEDVTVSSGAAVVFLDAVAADRVQDQVLDAKTTETTSAFFLRP